MNDSFETPAKPVKVTAYDYRNRKITIDSLDQELSYVNAVNDFRKENGLPTARNAYSWWKYVLVTLTYVDSATYSDVLTMLGEIDIKISKSYSSHLARACDGVLPDRVERQYTNKLPAVLHFLKIDVSTTPSVRGRDSLVFTYRDRKFARTWLKTNIPETNILFAQLDEHFEA